LLTTLTCQPLCGLARRLLACVAAFGILAGGAHAQAGANGQPSAAESGSGNIDQQIFFPVQLNEGDAQTYNIWGELRSRPSPQDRTLLILLSGLATDHRSGTSRAARRS
jgi:hypothetical protein